MELIFETNGGIRFEIQVSHYDNLQKIKARVEADRKIPIAAQTLIFNGNIIRNDMDLLFAALTDGSLVHLQIAANHLPPHDSSDADSNSPPEMHDDCEFRPPSPEIIILTLKFPALKKVRIVRADGNATIETVKEKIRKMGRGPIAIGGIVLKHENGMELRNERRLIEYQNISEVTVEFRRGMDLRVKLPGQKYPIAVEICLEDTIRKLKRKLLQEMEGLGIPIPMGHQMVIRHENGNELPNHKMLLECQISLYTTTIFTLEIRP